MRELMLESPGLLNEPGPGPEIGLRDYLDFIDPGDDVNDSMDEIESYDEHFPQSLTIGTCLAAYQLLTNATVDLLDTTASASNAPSRGTSRVSRNNSNQIGMVVERDLSGASQILAFAAAQRAAQQLGVESNTYRQATAHPIAAYQAIQEAFFAAADHDGDGMLSLAEAKAHGMDEATFREIDADGNGQLTKEEFAQWQTTSSYIEIDGGGGGGGAVGRTSSDA